LTHAIYLTAKWPGLHDLQWVFEAWQSAAPHLDNRLTSQLEIHRDEIVLLGVLAGGSETDALQMLAALLSVGTPDGAAKDQGWADTYAGFQIPTADEPANWKFLSQFVFDPFPRDAVRVIESLMAKAPTSDCNFFTNAFGGAVKGSEPSGGSAFAHRNALFYAE